MDVQPIYCAEQIVVPPDLADILKAYTKEIIRRQPGDIIEFSAKYFQNLASAATSVASAPAPTREQLRQVYERSGASHALTPAQLQALCKQAGIADAVVAKVMEVGSFSEELVNKDRFVFLMLAMSCEDFNRVVLGIFDVFSSTGRLEAEQFCTLISFLGPDMDADVGPAFLDALRSDFRGKSEVTYSDAADAGTLSGKMGIQ